MTRPSMRQRRSPGLLVLALALGLFALHAAFVGVRPGAGALRERHVRRAKDDEDDDSLSEFFIEDVSPVGRRVVKVYRQLKAMKGEQEEEVAKIMDALAPEQKKMLNSVLIARQSQDRPIETSKPENGDSPERLYKKLQMLKGVATALHKCWGGTGKRGGDSTAQVLSGEGEGGRTGQAQVLRWENGREGGESTAQVLRQENGREGGDSTAQVLKGKRGTALDKVKPAAASSSESALPVENAYLDSI
ncbi:hypothetical protein AK812_SmicGene43659 [Symbiodinium microadriaticum]|uniref:Transmembrane protein n=1 Tax=Symbiodinium microadriaticum TaxID=2951 RepID=A0A1Q9C0I5_SYMMI|nr:hypothetical protein AK812_SmicGene43659 [Symbiodinium microadriaticum]